MRICFVTPSIFSYGGVQRVTAVVASYLSRHHDVTIVTYDDAEQKDTSFYGLNTTPITYRTVSYGRVPKLKRLCCKSYSWLFRHCLPTTPLTSRLYAHSSFPGEERRPLVNCLNEGHYDVIVGVHATISARLGAMRSLFPRAILIGWIHNSYEALFGNGSHYIGPQLANYYAYQWGRLHHTIVLSRYDASLYQQLHHLSTTVIYNPLTLVPGGRAKGGTRRFLAIGRLSAGHKGFDLLIPAFRRFLDLRREEEATDRTEETALPWTLHIVGEGEEEAMLRQLITENHLDENVFIHHFTDNVTTYYQQADYYILSSRWEGFGLVLVEAMAHALPVISSTLPTSVEVMDNKAIYFPTGDIEGMAQAMLRATHADWLKWSERSLQRSQLFAPEEIIAQWEQLINLSSSIINNKI